MEWAQLGLSVQIEYSTQVEYTTVWGRDRGILSRPWLKLRDGRDVKEWRIAEQIMLLLFNSTSQFI